MPKFKKQEYPPELVDAVREAYASGASQVQVGKRLGVTKKVVFNVMRRHNIAARQQAPASPKPPRRYRKAEGLRYVPEFHIWRQMIYRCEDPSRHGYERYGGRGIKVCQRWLDSFHDFLSDMGPRPSPLHSLDRADNDGNYEPANCRWATRQVQILNRSLTRPVSTDKGEYFPSTREACRQIGANAKMVKNAVASGAKYMGRAWSNAPLIGMVSESGEYSP